MFFILMYYSLIQKKNRFVILKLLGFTKKKKKRGEGQRGKKKIN